MRCGRSEVSWRAGHRWCGAASDIELDLQYETAERSRTRG